jgi:hypothetical protein
MVARRPIKAGEGDGLVSLGDSRWSSRTHQAGNSNDNPDAPRGLPATMKAPATSEVVPGEPTVRLPPGGYSRIAELSEAHMDIRLPRSLCYYYLISLKNHMQIQLLPAAFLQAGGIRMTDNLLCDLSQRWCHARSYPRGVSWINQPLPDSFSGPRDLKLLNSRSLGPIGTRHLKLDPLLQLLL